MQRKCSPDKEIQTERQTDRQRGIEAGGRQRKTEIDRCMARLTNRQADSPTNGRTV